MYTPFVPVHIAHAFCIENEYGTGASEDSGSIEPGTISVSVIKAS